MSEEVQKIIDINQVYVDQKLREFFERDKNTVDIDNICLFSAKTIEEYNQSSETKLTGPQKLEAANELAKTIIEKVVVFVPEDDRRKVTKNIFNNLDSISSTIQFIIRISNDPNLVNAGKWVRETAKRTGRPLSPPRLY